MPELNLAYKPSALKVVNNGHTVQVNYDAGSKATLATGAYDLVQFHFHTPSEEQVNGKSFDMVWHLVHKNAEGKLAVVAVLVKEGQANDVIGAIGPNLPKETNKEAVVAGTTVDINKLLPADRHYYHYQGSLTTPPCSEGVSWHVLKTPVEASKAQIAQFKALFGVNARPVQSLNGRKLQESM